jgi:hypothetical protein
MTLHLKGSGLGDLRDRDPMTGGGSVDG